ncbi:MAG: DUF4093 domain-containing protein [Clostridia bacterium]|nr:DUF4093 domain-containing protein [Clostridia bacterium]
MIHIKETIVVEGKFDKEQIKKVTDAPVICTGGFALYTDKSIIKSIRTMAQKTGVIVLTDADSAGFRIRNYIKQCVGKQGTVKHAYIPSIEGKERRKRTPGKEGLLGVEGISEQSLLQILETVTEVMDAVQREGKPITKAMLFADGLSGGEESAQKRKKLARKLGLPVRISANALIEVLNAAVGYDEYKKILKEL